MPLALVGLISCLALWDVFKFCSERWGLDQYPIVRQCLIRFAQCVAAVILICSNVQMAIFCALTVSYAVCGQRLSSVVGRNYSVSPTGEVNTLKEEVTTLKGQLATQDEQIKAQSEQMRAQSEHIKAENEQMRAQMSMIVQALAVSGLQIQLPAPDLTPPSTSQPPHLPDTQ